MTKNMTAVNSVVSLSRITGRKPKPAQLPPHRYILDIGKAISLALTLALYEITPNAAAIELIGRDE